MGANVLKSDSVSSALASAITSQRLQSCELLVFGGHSYDELVKMIFTTNYDFVVSNERMSSASERR